MEKQENEPKRNNAKNTIKTILQVVLFVIRLFSKRTKK